ncbi:Ig-like domain-containing protein [Myxococcus sp. 1LA]
MLIGTAPVSPANDNTPVLHVITEPRATVRFFAGTACIGSALASLTADSHGQVALPLFVADNSTSAYVAQAMDEAGNVSACSAALTFIEDSRAPSELAATVMDGLADPELEYQNSNTRVAARWSGFVDSVGIHHYEVAVTSIAACPGNASSIQDVGATSSVELTVLTLAEQRYYSCVRAVDEAGNTSGWKMSNGFIVDVTPPRVVSATPDASSASASPWAAIEVSFSETTLDTASVTPDSFHVTANGVTLSAGTVSCVAGRCTLALRQMPAFGAQVRVAIDGVKDLAGNAMTSSHAWSYSVRAAQWGSPLRFSTSSSTGVPAPVLTMDASGVATVLYVDSGLRARRHKPGAAWEAEQRVGVGTLGSSPPKQAALTTLSDGTPMAVVEALPLGEYRTHKAYGILASGSDSSVQSWSVPQLLGENTGLSVLAPRLVAAPNNGALAAWSEEGPTQTFLWVQRYTGSAGWGAPVLVRSINDLNWIAAGDGHDVRVDSRGDGLLVWSELGSALQYSREEAGGWSEPARGDSLGGRYPRTVLNADGTGIATWIRRYQDDDRLYAKSFSLDAGFDGQEVPLHTQGSIIGEARMAADANGNGFVLWSHNIPPGFPGAGWGLWCARYVRGSGWQPAQQLATDFGGGEALYVAPSGTAIVVYSRTEGAPRAVWARRFVPGTGWSAATRLDFATVSGGPGYLEMVGSSLGNAAVIWTRDDPDTGRDSLVSVFLE